MPTNGYDRRVVAVSLLAAGVAGCGKVSGAAAASLPDDMTLGSPGAKHTVVEYASVGCPVCGHWARDVYPQFKSSLIDTGKVRLVYREMLVGSGVELTAAAAGFILARKAGASRYFSVVDSIYRDQEQLFNDPRGTLLKIANSCGISDPEFRECLSDDAAYAALNARVERNAKKDNVNSTPTFVVDGKKLDAGYQPLSVIVSALRKA